MNPFQIVIFMVFVLPTWIIREGFLVLKKELSERDPVWGMVYIVLAAIIVIIILMLMIQAFR